MSNKTHRVIEAGYLCMVFQHWLVHTSVLAYIVSYHT